MAWVLAGMAVWSGITYARSLFAKDDGRSARLLQQAIWFLLLAIVHLLRQMA